MSHFPVTSSQLSPLHLSTFIKATYGFSESTSVRLLKTGINHSYAVHDGDQKAVFRVYSHRWRSESEIYEEIRLLKHLRSAGVPASFPLTDQFGRYVHDFDAPEGVRYGVMFSYAEGDKRFYYSESLHERCGQMMAEIHRITEGFRLDREHYTASVLAEQTPSSVLRFIDADCSEAEFVKKASRMVANAFEKADACKLRSGAVHLDMWFDNMHFQGEDDIVLFDFDFCGNGWLCLDIGYYLMQLFNTEREPDRILTKSRAFLCGYESQTTLNEEERRLLPAAGLAVFLFYLHVQCKRFDDFSSVFMNGIHVRRFVDHILKKWVEFHDLDDDGFARQLRY